MQVHWVQSLVTKNGAYCAACDTFFSACAVIQTYNEVNFPQGANCFMSDFAGLSSGLPK